MNRIIIASLAIVGLLIAGCKKDNFKKPTSVLKGRVIYDKEALGLRSNGVQLELWQPGYELFTKIPVFVGQDGAFSASLSDGQYKLVQLPGNGPWVNNTDSIDVTVRGETIVDVTVQPYFIIQSATFAKNGDNITATFTVTQVNTSLPLESVSLYLGKNIILDHVNNQAEGALAGGDIPDLTQPLTLNVTIPASLAAGDYLFARVGVKTSGVAERLYSMPQQVQLK